MFDCDQIYMEDKICYCLAPGYVPLSDPMISGEVTLTTHSYIHQIYYDKSECFTRNYTIFSGTNYCLKFIATLAPWPDAEQHCKQNGGHLVSAETPDKLNHIRLTTDSNYPNIYLGGFRPAEATDNSVYRWINHERVDNSFWRPNEPNSFNRESVVEIYDNGLLNNRNKDTKFTFICEILVTGLMG
ncbi:hypothetical protein SNE40_013447 [Patella caerulea]|uniref:C-type lectin domain-containing protein n=1 Tax=Patella caerulea TaxID=87958 RepID=A0AAN8PH62_PATCE